MNSAKILQLGSADAEDCPVKTELLALQVAKLAKLSLVYRVMCSGFCSGIA